MAIKGQPSYQQPRGPFADDIGRYTAFQRGCDDFIEGLPMNPGRYGIRDDYRIGAYNAGWTQESIDKMQVVDALRRGQA